MFSSVAYLSAHTHNLTAHPETSPQEVVILVDDNFHPYAYEQNGEAKGLLVDLIKRIDENLPEYTISLLPKNWQIAKTEIRKGNFLGLAGVYFHAHDWPYMYPYSYFMFRERVHTVCHKDTPLSQGSKWPSDYSGLKIANVAGYDGWVSGGVRQRKINNVNFFEYPGKELALKAVHNKLVDCSLFEIRAFEYTQQNLGQSSQFEASNVRLVSFIEEHTVHIGYSEAAIESNDFPYAKHFQKRFDQELFILLTGDYFTPIYEQYGLKNQ